MDNTPATFGDPVMPTQWRDLHRATDVPERRLMRALLQQTLLEFLGKRLTRRRDGDSVHREHPRDAVDAVERSRKLDL